MEYTMGMLREGALQGKTVLVTGGGTGLGKAMGDYFSQLGANLIITSRSMEVLKKSAEEIDRKSTRLNSSHVRISYAVFCLKKKRRVSDTSSTQPRRSPSCCPGDATTSPVPNRSSPLSTVRPSTAASRDTWTLVHASDVRPV